ncbi:MAG: cytochrome c biogenesis CcdA family protein [Actinophytocola sp.]|uniref:cytochrome c biogenesis CcdA family protein n=1 Tax=Actinophytocola sp. TaxID=1872138 RepID=UPI003D6B3CAF
MPVVVAFLAGGLAVLNPCGFAMLPAFLSLYVGAEEQQLPPARTRMLQGVLVGLLVTAGFLAVFVVLAGPIALGASQVATAVPWLGFGIGVVMGVVAVATLTGRRIEINVRRVRPGDDHRRPRTMLMFGVGYGLASLGCTLPIFLVVIGASLTGGGALGAVIVFGAYALGMAVVLMALSVGAAILRDGVARVLAKALPRLRWVNGGLLLLVSGYLVYYWGMTLFSTVEKRAADPVVSFMDDFTAAAQTWAGSGGGAWLLFAAVAVVAAAGLATLWQWVLKPERADHDEMEPSRSPG